jgi:glucose/arabinose dehydrogenase
MTRRLSWTALACASLLVLTACGDDEDGIDPASQTGPNPKLPEIHQYLFPPMNVPSMVGWKEGETPTVPQDLKVEALATGLEHPRSLYVLPNGDILVAESKAPFSPTPKRPKDLVMGWVEKNATSAGHTGNSQRVSLLRENPDGHGTALKTVFIEHVNAPFGMALVGGDLYVAATDAVLRFPYHDGDTKETEKGSILTELPGGPIDHHWTKSMVASRDGSTLYVGVGSNSNITENGIEAEKNRAAVLQIDRATGRFRIFADGIRNPTGLAWEPRTGVLWAVANERDEIGANLVPDYLTSVKEGAFYGWPYSYFGQHIDPRVMPQRPEQVARAIPPDYALSSHVAPLGLVFYDGDGLPDRFKGGVFIGEHGSWNRKVLNGYKVVFVAFRDGHPDGKPEDVVTGFLGPDGKARGRPVGVAVDKSGALLIADDVGNTVWRVSKAAP